jgi:hypothetical protein
MAPKENPARRGRSGVCPRLRGSGERAEAPPQRGISSPATHRVIAHLWSLRDEEMA